MSKDSLSNQSALLNRSNRVLIEEPSETCKLIKILVLYLKLNKLYTRENLFFLPGISYTTISVKTLNKKIS